LVIYHFFGPITSERPLGPFLISSLSNEREIMDKNRSIRSSKNFLSKYFSRPRSAKSIFVLLPSVKNSSACLAFSSRSWSDVPMPMRTLFISTSFCFFLLFVEIFAAVHYFRDRRIRSWGYFDQVETRFFRFS